MKKIFLPLLALVGMVTGFTLTSCGGGGGGSNFEGLSITTGTSPETTMYFVKESEGYYRVSFGFGSRNADGHFTESSLTYDDKNGTPVLEGTLSITTESGVKDAASWLGFPPGSSVKFAIQGPIWIKMMFNSSKPAGSGTMTRKGTILVYNDKNTPQGTINLEDGKYEAATNTPDDEDDITGAVPDKSPTEISFHYENAGGLMKKSK